jgi:hypothetical protein
VRQFLWVLHRDDFIDKEEAWADAYCRRYYEDPEISELLDAYLDCVREVFDGMREGASADDALSMSPQFDESWEKVKAAIRERIWEEFPRLRRDRPADRLRVWEIGEECIGEFYYRLFWPFVW